MIVDSHVHVWAEPSAHLPHQRLSGETAHPIESLIKDMNGVGIDRAVLVQPSLYGFDNTYIAQCLRQYSDRLMGVGCIDVRLPDASRQAEHWIRKAGLHGLRLMLIESPGAELLNEPGTDRIFEQAAEWGIPISLFISPEGLAWLDPLVDKFPHAKLIIEHMGRPDLSTLPLEKSIKRLLDFAKAPSLYVKLSGLHVISQDMYPYADLHPLIQMVWEAFGSSRMLWGSDSPGVLASCNYAESVSIVQEHLGFLGVEDKGWILAKTAAQLFSRH